MAGWLGPIMFDTAQLEEVIDALDFKHLLLQVRSYPINLESLTVHDDFCQLSLSLRTCSVQLFFLQLQLTYTTPIPMSNCVYVLNISIELHNLSFGLIPIKLVLFPLYWEDIGGKCTSVRGLQLLKILGPEVKFLSKFIALIFQLGLLLSDRDLADRSFRKADLVSRSQAVK